MAAVVKSMVDLNWFGGIGNVLFIWFVFCFFTFFTIFLNYVLYLFIVKAKNAVDFYIV